ncbi:putative membrane protein [Arcobacter venerupis]|uniref:Membrane protein n=1 Tax=Arcobacter venerupis TaxID=1054033 RepID=A0AAE7E4W4_9BACT|nr:P-loop NTPase fold protein [Arcobacter venerupis]QKF68335.1 putative membrane protein [Arcobacter venerupis]RWS48522.1 hypothetical protein CKA56_13900 [Arcobacter venerupis]
MSNQQRLEEYLVGNEKSYLKDDISNGKVIMLSGKWGSGKTHFWKNIIEKDLIESQTKKQKAYVYSSLYGNRTIDKIEDNIYAQAYLCSVGGKNAVISGYEKVKDFGKRFGSFCSLLDVSKLVDGIDDIQQKNIKKSALSYLENGGIVCFDDFERKSKDIDLNDLFGFISHLAIDLNCKVVIILNDDVFEGKEKNVFSRVKEKSVSKFLKYEPSIRDLFKSIIFEKDNSDKFKYSKLRKYVKIILKIIEDTQELNARIYIQVLDNLVEWCDKKQEINDNILRCLILVNINFILYHKIVTSSIKQERVVYDNLDIKRYCIKNMENDAKFIKLFNDTMDIACSKKSIIKRLIDEVSQVRKEIYNQSVIDNSIKFINENHSNIYAINFATMFSFDENVSKRELNKINNFIETGILINE